MDNNIEHISNKDELLKVLKTSLKGLSTDDVDKRLKDCGYNELPKEKKDSLFLIFIRTFKDPIIYVLIIAVILSFVAGETLDAFAILFIILIDSIVSTIQEYRAEKNSEALKNLIKVITKVIRNNKHTEVDSRELVPGDIIVLESGSKISADARIISCTNLTVNESILTGESLGVVKSADAKVLNLENKSSMLYAGTTVLTGRALAVVIATGINTELGQIAKKVTETEETKSPLTIRMEKFSKQITLIIIGIAVIITAFLIIKNYDAMEIFLSVVALSVSAMPEGLPLALTLALTIGSNRMGKRNVIVKKLNSVESLGSCTVIASDKTGTLTVNEQTAKKIVLANGEMFDIDGNGYNDNGKVKIIDSSNIENAKLIAKLGYFNNEAMLEKHGSAWENFGDSIDVAFLALARKLSVHNEEFLKVFEIPYESEKKYSALFYKENKEVRCTAKGSLEVILDFCKYQFDGKNKVKINKNEIMRQNNELASKGYRVLAICDGEVKTKKKYSEKEVDSLIFIGLVGFIDPVRKDAIASIRECDNAGIKVIMITGDHALTAYAIAKELNIVQSKDEVVTGSDLNLYYDNEEKFDKFIKDKKVFARVTPLEKLKIVESLQRQGEFVAVTGDGVNDAPAIKAANIGIAMGSGTDAAKETAKMIIIDDRFTSIVAGIEEGRNAYSNIRKISILLLSCGLAELLFYIFSVALNMPIPLVAIQLLWLNLVTDGLQDMALSFERETDNIMREKPRSTKESIFEKELIKQVIISGLTMGILVFVVWYFLINVFNFEVGIARGYVLALMVFIQNMHVLNCRSEEKSVFSNGFKNNKFVLLTIVGTIILQIIVMETPLLSKFLQTSSVPYMHLLLLFGLSTLVLFVMEIYKYIRITNKEKKCYNKLEGER